MQTRNINWPVPTLGAQSLLTATAGTVPFLLDVQQISPAFAVALCPVRRCDHNMFRHLGFCNQCSALQPLDPGEAKKLFALLFVYVTYATPYTDLANVH